MADYLSSIKDLMGQYGGSVKDAPYWANQYQNQGADFLNSPSFKNMTGNEYSGQPGGQEGYTQIRSDGQPGGGAGGTTGGGALFDMPTLTPESGTTTSTATGATTSAGTSGIDWSSPGVAGLLDQIKNWTGIASGNAANAPGNINNFYSNMMRNALQPQAFQGTLNNLRQRNMLDSSVASDALAGTASNIAGQVGNQALSSYLKGFDVQQGMPNMLGQLANVLGGRGTTSTGTTSATGTQTDPMAAYRLAFGYV